MCSRPLLLEFLGMWISGYTYIHTYGPPVTTIGHPCLIYPFLPLKGRWLVCDLLCPVNSSFLFLSQTPREESPSWPLKGRSKFTSSSSSTWGRPTARSSTSLRRPEEAWTRQSGHLLEEDSGDSGQGVAAWQGCRKEKDESESRWDLSLDSVLSLPLSLSSPQSDPEWIFRLFGHVSVLFVFLYLFVFKNKREKLTSHQVDRNCGTIAHRQHTSSLSICGCWAGGLLQSRD